MTKRDESLTKSSSFTSQIFAYGISRIILSPDFIIASLLFAFVLTDKLANWGLVKSLDADALIFLATISATIFAIIITALAIILSFSSSKFVAFLRKTNKLSSIMFVFWMASSTYLVVLALCFLKFFVSANVPLLVSGLGRALTLGFFTYALLQTFYVVATLIRFAQFLNYFENERAD